jgi:hypothetical protein
LIDEQNKLGQRGSDKGFLAAVLRAHHDIGGSGGGGAGGKTGSDGAASKKPHPHLAKPKYGTPSFIVRHYAGTGSHSFVRV